MKRYKISEDLKELIIYLTIILLICCIPLLSLFFYMPDSISGLEGFVWYFVFLILSAISLVIIFIVTILTIRKAKGKYLRNFFDNLKYSTAVFVFVIFALISKYFFKISALYVIPFCYAILFSMIFGLINKKAKNTLIFMAYIMCSIVLAPMILNHPMMPDGIKTTLHSIENVYISIYFAILIYNLFKFIKSKNQTIKQKLIAK